MMRIAIPTDNGVICSHFGHSPVFTIVEVSPDNREIVSSEVMTPPPHEHGVIPAWLNRLGCTHVMAGGIGHRAVAIFEQNGVRVIAGVASVKPEDAVRAWLDGRLDTDVNPCHEPGCG
jgi:predicted Fe-Mo cluster-binding NifX family protein